LGLAGGRRRGGNGELKKKKKMEDEENGRRREGRRAGSAARLKEKLGFSTFHFSKFCVFTVLILLNLLISSKTLKVKIDPDHSQFQISHSPFFLFFLFFFKKVNRVWPVTHDPTRQTEINGS
jgi:hypothetical protein